MGEFINKTQGKIKQAAGALTANKALKREGEQDERKGKVEGATCDCTARFDVKRVDCQTSAS